jgi:hypothetical protein
LSDFKYQSACDRWIIYAKAVFLSIFELEDVGLIDQDAIPSIVVSDFEGVESVGRESAGTCITHFYLVPAMTGERSSQVSHSVHA